jgi:hypothetical protein
MGRRLFKDQFYIDTRNHIGYTTFNNKAKRPQPHNYTRELKTLGDHLRKKRLDLKLLQREAAERLGVNETTTYNRMHAVSPALWAGYLDSNL